VYNRASIPALAGMDALVISAQHLKLNSSKCSNSIFHFAAGIEDSSNWGIPDYGKFYDQRLILNSVKFSHKNRILKNM